MQQVLKSAVLAALITAPMLAQRAEATEGIASPILPPTIGNEGATVLPKGRYIVVLNEPATASFRGSADVAAPDRINGRLDVNGPATLAYIDRLDAQQVAFLDQATEVLGRPVAATRRMQHAINAVVLELDAREAVALQALPEVRFVDAPGFYEIDTDVGPTLIGAPGIWAGSTTNGLPGTYGEGVVVGIIDSGVNFRHPSFAAVSEPGTPSEYTHVNPLGDGNYLGFCADNPTSMDFVCNSKLIGGHDFVYDLVEDGVLADPPTVIEDPFPDDENGHGTHVASTAIGNFTTANFRGVDPGVSGVAPRANVVSYDVCYTDASSGRGLCPFAANTAAINQAVADGIIDVINYSISGGSFPWAESASLAFLGASDAGIFVSASAGNGGPGPSTLGHLEPWVASVAASTHGRFFSDASVDAGTSTGVGAIEGSGPELTAAITDDLRYNAANPEGCTSGGGVPAGFYDDGGDGTIALISRGSCSFAEKVDNATTAGARAVIVFNNRSTTPFSMGALESTTIPGVMISQTDGEAIRGELFAKGGLTTTTITPRDPAVSTVDAGSADVIAAFSSRGPNVVGLVKPDITAPGVSILAAFNDGNGEEATGPEFRLLQGTSMSSPHNAGAAALLRALYPSWSPSEVKSALMLTAETSIRDDNGDGTVGDATPLDTGAGRVELSAAPSTPIVLHETTINYQNADPDLGGDPRTLNLPSFSDNECGQTCSWTRTIRSVADAPVTFTASFVGDGEITGTVTPSTFEILPGSPLTITVEADTSGATTRDVWKFGSVELDDGHSGEPLRMPVTIFAVGAIADVTPGEIAVTLDTGMTSDQTINVGNNGGSDLTFDVNTNPTANGPFVNVPRAGNGGILGMDNVSSPGRALVAADDIVVSNATTLTSVAVEGFQNGADLVNTTLSIQLYVWEDAGGRPAGSPFDVDPNAVLALSIPVPDPNVSLAGDGIAIDLTGLGQELPLMPGTYWVGVQPSTLADWGWFYGPNTGATPPQLIAPAFGLPDWFQFPAIGINETSLNLSVTASVECGADWLSETPLSGIVPPAGTGAVTVTIDSTGFGRGDYRAFECIETNETGGAPQIVGVTLTIPNILPVATGETLTVDEGTAATEVDGPETSLLANDTDADMDPLTLSATPATAPVNGTVTLNPDGTFEYIHDGSETTSDSFVYEVCDNAPTPGCATATVDITVTPVNDPPVTGAESILMSEGGLSRALESGETSLIANDSDPEMDDPITVSATPAVEPTHGTVTLNPDGTFEYRHDGSQTTTDSFDYEVCDALGACSTQTVTITIVGINSAPTPAADTISVLIGTTATTTAAGDDSVLANDTDPEGDGLTVNTTPVTAPSFGMLTLNGDGTFSYAHDGLSEMTDSFTYEVCDDGQPQLCATAEVTIEVLPETLFSSSFETARVNVGHLAPFSADDAATAVSINVNGDEILTGVQFDQFSGYAPLDPGTALLEVFAPPATPPAAIMATVNLVGTTDYTVLALGDGVNQPLSLLPLVDDNTPPTLGSVRIRIVHAAPFAMDLAATAVSIRLDGEDGAVGEIVNGLASVEFGQESGFFELPAGTYDLQVASPDGTTVFIDLAPVELTAGAIVTVFAIGDGANQDLGITAFFSDGTVASLPLEGGE